ncbi:MAG: hypothetical protein IH984_04610 [Planctomycetes bacterium]|nr:hypothetical protein [Planctomycetota bacterium]
MDILQATADDARQWKMMYSQTDPAQILHTFDPINKSNYSACHVPEQASDNCLSCHNYHAGFASFSSVSTAFTK